MQSIRVGDFELYPSERMLSASGKPVELGARAFDLLLVLVENPGRLVTKATLIERVWPRVIVDENNLPAQIAGLRKILGADAIRTVPGFGYRLELSVSTCERTNTVAAPVVPGPEPVSMAVVVPDAVWRRAHTLLPGAGPPVGFLASGPHRAVLGSDRSLRLHPAV